MIKIEPSQENVKQTFTKGSLVINSDKVVAMILTEDSIGVDIVVLDNPKYPTTVPDYMKCVEKSQWKEFKGRVVIKN